MNHKEIQMFKKMILVVLVAMLGIAALLSNVYATGLGEESNPPVHPELTEEHLEQIWERFYQADSSWSNEGRHSSGLGLTIVREIVQAHGGKITVRSEVNEGTAFIFSLLVTQANAMTIISRRK